MTATLSANSDNPASTVAEPTHRVGPATFPLVPKLQLGNACFGSSASFPESVNRFPSNNFAHALRSGASRSCVPKLELGNEGKSVTVGGYEVWPAQSRRSVSRAGVVTWAVVVKRNLTISRLFASNLISRSFPS